MLWPSSSSVNADQMRVCSSKGALSAMGQFAEKAAHQDTLQHECSPGMTWSGGPGLGQTQAGSGIQTSVLMSGVLLMHLRETQSKVWRPKINNRPNRYKIRHPTLKAFGPQTGTNQDYPPGLHISAREKKYVYVYVCVYVSTSMCMPTL